MKKGYKCPFGLAFGLSYSPANQDCDDCPISNPCLKAYKKTTEVRVCPYGGIFGFSIDDLDECDFCEFWEGCEDCFEEDRRQSYKKNSVCFAGITSDQETYFYDRGEKYSIAIVNVDLSPFVVIV